MHHTNHADIITLIKLYHPMQIDNYFLNEWGCEVWSFDPSMKKVVGDYKQGPKHKFFYQGIGDHDGQHVGASTWGRDDG